MRSAIWTVVLPLAVALVVIGSPISLTGLSAVAGQNPAVPHLASPALPASDDHEPPADASLSEPGPRTGTAGPPPALLSSGMAERAEASARAAGFPTRFVFVPRPSASPTQERMSQSEGHVTPLYQAAPAPMGIGDFGLRTAQNGSVQPYTLQTTSLKATMDANGTGIQPLYVLDGSPDAYSAQLNAVLTNVSILGNTSYQFWTQNVVVYYAQSHLLYLIVNVWNFSSLFLSPNAISSYGNVSMLSSSLFAFETEVPNVIYPFNVSLYLNSTVRLGDDAVDFTAVLGSGIFTRALPFDYVIFNSNGTAASPAPFAADGFDFNPLGLTDDFEFVLGGPGGGSQVNLVEAQATMSLDFWNATSASYESVPSALSYGGDSGETSSGANVEWTEGASGPLAQISTGPSILGGLWNASGAPGVATVQTDVNPSDAFIFVQPAVGPFLISAPEWAPTLGTTSISLSPGSYTFSAMQSDYVPFNATFTGLTAGSVASFAPTLGPDPAVGVTTPIWVWNNDQFPGVSTGGSGTPTNPYLVDDRQSSPISSLFGLMNDYSFPVFTGVFFEHTSASAELLDPGPFEVQLPADPLLPGLPPTNDLGYTFYGVSNVSVVDGSAISGWFTGLLLSGVPNYATFNMVFWNSSDNLVAGNTFDTESGGIYLYGGSNNTLWNNSIEWNASFVWSPPPIPAPVPLWPQSEALGIEEAESSDTVYNNAVYTTLTASTPRTDPYTGANATDKDRWNIENESAAVVTHAPGFPDIALTGSIVGTSYQGGNFWWDYGFADNPFGKLPYTADGNIRHGGDSVPLVVAASATFQENGYTGTGTWGVTVTRDSFESEGSTSGTALTIRVPYDGLYNWSVTPPTEYVAVPDGGSVAVVRNTVVPLTFELENGWLTGTVVPPNATLFVNDSTNTSIVHPGATGGFNETVLTGTYSVNATAFGYYRYSTNVTVGFDTATVLAISMIPVNGTLVVNVMPAAAAANATVTIDSVARPLSSGSLHRSLPPGMYWVNVTSPGFNTSQATPTVVSFGTTYDNVTLVLAGNGTIVGLVSPATAYVAVNGVIVPLGASGNFTTSVGPGTYVIAASDPGYNSMTVNATVLADRTTYVNLTLTPTNPHTSAFSPGELGYVGVFAAIVILFAGAALVLWQRGRTPPPAGSPAPGENAAGGAPPPPQGTPPTGRGG
jgi:thermopsin